MGGGGLGLAWSAKELINVMTSINILEQIERLVKSTAAVSPIVGVIISKNI